MKKCLNYGFRPRKLFKRLLFMKMLVVLLLVNVVNVSAITLAQDSKVTLSMEGAELEKVLWEIHEQTGLVFLYSAEDVKSVKEVSVEAKDETVKSVLNRCLKNSDLEYEFKNQAVTLHKSSKPINSPANSQQQTKRKISGVVLDDQGLSLPGFQF